MSKAAARLYASLLLSISTLFLASSIAQNTATPLLPTAFKSAVCSMTAMRAHTYVSPYSFPEIFNDQAGCNTLNDICNIAGIQGSIFIDQFSSVPGSPVAGSLSLPSTGGPAPIRPSNRAATSRPVSVRNRRAR